MQKHFSFLFLKKALSNVITALLLVLAVISFYIVFAGNIAALARTQTTSIIESYNIQTEKVKTALTIIDYFSVKNKTYVYVYNYGLSNVSLAYVILDGEISDFKILNPYDNSTVDFISNGIHLIIINGAPANYFTLVTDKGEAYEIKV